MRPINLRPHEARQLAATGRVLVVRPAKFIPDDYPELFDDRSAKLFETHAESPFPEPGAKVWGREAWWQNGYWACDYWHGWQPSEVDNPDCGRRFDPPAPGYERHWRKRSAATMPRWASRFPSLVVESRRFCRLSGLDDNDRKQTRVCRPDDPANPKLHLVDLVEFEEDWDLYNPKHPAASDPWIWAALLRRED